MGLLSFLFGRKPAPQQQPAKAAPKSQPNRKGKHKLYPIFQSDYEPAYDWQRLDVERSNPAGFTHIKGANDITVEGVNIEGRTEDFFGRFDRSTAELEIRREPDNPEDANALAVFGKPNQSATANLLGYVPATISAQVAAEFTDGLPLKARLRTIGQKSNGQAVFIRFALLYPKAADRKLFLKNA
ncbi:hypothetical protein [Celeribacter naphthalenivorans]|uniref:hypothetical protein n=1 Tax=Celeribacter naphthalenivorans TaxID=1614694 RepID=UPI001CFBC972|nr:hypothetical protein [Celeribacter naphthalenivorans]